MALTHNLKSIFISLTISTYNTNYTVRRATERAVVLFDTVPNASFISSTLQIRVQYEIIPITIDRIAVNIWL